MLQIGPGVSAGSAPHGTTVRSRTERIASRLLDHETAKETPHSPRFSCTPQPQVGLRLSHNPNLYSRSKFRPRRLQGRSTAARRSKDGDARPAEDTPPAAH